MITHYRGILIADGYIHFDGKVILVPDPEAKIDQLLEPYDPNRYRP